MSLLFSLCCQSTNIGPIAYFAGKWEVVRKALPQGDTRMFVVLEKIRTTMTECTGVTGKDISKLIKLS